MAYHTHILELLDIIERYGPSRREIFLRRDPYLSEAKSLLQLPVKGEYKNASARSKLKKRLLNTLFHLEVPTEKRSVSFRRNYELRRALFLITNLNALGARNAATSLARKYFPLASLREATAIKLELLVCLSTAAALRGDRKEYEQLQTRVIETSATYHAEVRAASDYRKLILLFASSGNDHPELALWASEAARSVKRDFDYYRSYSLGLSYYVLHCTSLQMRRSHHLAIDSCREALAFLNTRRHLATAAELNNFELQLGISQLHSAQYSEASNTFKGCLEKTRTGQQQWFLIQESVVYLKMHLGDYSEASLIIREVMEHARFKLQSIVTQEKWRLFQFFARVAMNELQIVHARSRDISAKQLLRTSALQRSDKLGFNLAILILNVLIALDQHQVNLALDHLDQLSTYKRRHITKAIHPQTFALLSFLTSLGRSRLVLPASNEKIDSIRRNIEAQRKDSALENFMPLPAVWVFDRVVSSIRAGSLLHN